MNYIGCILFGLFFLVMTSQSKGTLHDCLLQTVSWIHDWSPFSYFILLIPVAAVVVAIRTMATWPKLEAPEKAKMIVEYIQESAPESDPESAPAEESPVAEPEPEVLPR